MGICRNIELRSLALSDIGLRIIHIYNDLNPMDDLLTQTIGAAKEAGQAIMRYYLDSFSVADKSPDNPVTDADLAANDLLKKRLSALLPKAGWLSEETADNPTRLNKSLVWVVDPLDGTKEFIMGIPEFAVSVALVEGKQAMLGVILNPATGELYYSRRGEGAFQAGRPIRVGNKHTLEAAQVDASRSERKRGEFEPFENLVQVKTVGSIAYKLARVASGQADATWSRGPKSEWDICAGTLLIEEAGGWVADLDYQPFHFNRSFPKVSGIVAANESLKGQLEALLTPHRHTARVD